MSGSARGGRVATVEGRWLPARTGGKLLLGTEVGRVSWVGWLAAGMLSLGTAACGGEPRLTEGAPLGESHRPRLAWARGAIAPPTFLDEQAPPPGAIAGAPPPKLPAPVRTIVTLSFDDGLASQRAVPGILAPHGLQASFFVCTGRLGDAGYLAWGDLELIAAAGHEIGGHTLDHDRLDELDDGEVVEAVCADRDALVERGFDPVSFAYPSSSSDARVAPIVGSCGYRTARSNQGLGRPDGGGCAHCPGAESLPPPDPLQLRSPRSMPGGITLEEMQAYVLRAEAEGGGWLNFTFHEVLDDCAGDAYCVESDLLGRFAAWLAGRAELGTVVRTQRQAFEAAQR